MYVSVFCFFLSVFLMLKYQYFFLLLHESIYYGYSLEVPQQGTSNEYPQHIFF